MPLMTASDGCRVHYEVRGQGEPVVLIPGLGGDGRFWEPVADRLEGQFRLLLVDHRGAGRSDRPDSPYTIEAIAGDVLAIVDAEGCSRAHLVGHSTGGTVVQTLAPDAPARIGSVVVSGSWPSPDARFRTLFRARLALLEAGRADIYQAFTHVLGYDADWIAAHEEELEAATGRANETLAPLAVTAARIRMLLAYDRAADLGRIEAPALVVGGRDDAMIPFEQSERIARSIPGAKLVELDGGHFYPRTSADLFARHVGEFLCGKPL
ncbi:alpha/beta hydrolase fold protein [Ancylobacter novellus DSM 506]|uniref:Alpha/beta hydrolase fold protein n=1 Tax=Ancylobacter novellus (strain ATCC 8093 / DSM 506 / JCM 20403 / CCM 1077 / IAM 12100 / NBRC 12443 / NCIMB 10456) TaxID=639283 RepID=D7A9W6_ANCN5|nr:alpha/beta hydrolase [Ancylobacter novellus]ADH88892.1 alpha/beta hydrolase fold protein [Ancylobacter novellus DSM 506]